MDETPDFSPAKAKGRYGAPRPKVPPFARYVGTSAWRKNRRRVRVYAAFRAAAGQAKTGPVTPAP